MMKIKYYKYLIISIICLFAGANLRAQDNVTVQISGIVSDPEGRPLSGVLVSGIETVYKTTTDIDGLYTLSTGGECSQLQFSLPGYLTQKAELNGEAFLDITLRRAETYNLEEQVLMGFTKQRKGDVTGAVSTVKGTELERTPIPNLGATLAGRLPGLIVRETSSEPSRISTSFWSRGASTNGAYQPLLVLDGFTYRDYAADLMAYISTMEVESISLLKDASTQALYGVQGGNGVLVITTKRGVQKKVSIDVHIDETMEQPTTQLTFIPSSDYVQMKNQAAYNDGLGEYYFFDRQTTEGFISGEDPELYPSNNWRELNMKDQTSGN